MGREAVVWGSGLVGSSMEPELSDLTLESLGGIQRMVPLFGSVWERTMKLLVASSSCSGMASRELMEEAMVIGSMLGLELNSSNLWDSSISNTLGSLKHLASLGRVDLVRESLWNEGGGEGL